MFYSVLDAISSGATTFGGAEGVMDPKGPIAAAEWQILLNSLGIMLVIVIPTIAATLGAAYWFRSSNKRGALAGFNYWFPKAFGFTLDERWGKAAFWCWLVGFYLAFMPLYVLGLLGMTRRLQHYDNLDWRPWLVVAALGVVVILAGIVCQIVQLVVSIRARDQLRVANDPWNGRTLEWSTASPPPAWNFAVLPRVAGLDAHWRSSESTEARSNQPAPTPEYKPIEAPKNSPIGFINAFFAVVTGFALIWHIWWMAGLGLLGAFAALLLFAFRDEDEIEMPAEQIAQFERRHLTEVA